MMMVVMVEMVVVVVEMIVVVVVMMIPRQGSVDASLSQSLQRIAKHKALKNLQARQLWRI